ncbi:MAG: hypothetical protein ABW175_09180 [Bradyrhizobium sp.]
MPNDGEQCGWRTIEFGPRSYGIERIKDRSLIGSIDQIDGRWQVEIQWPSRNDMIKDDFAEYIAAVAFVRGVAAAAARMSR